VSDLARQGGQRRLDRILEPAFAEGLSELSTDEVKGRRDECRAEAEYLSYVRRVLQGRLDILAAERARRAGQDEGPVVDRLPEILAEGPAGASRGGFLLTAVPEQEMTLARRQVDRLVAEVALSDLGSLTDERLGEAIEALAGEERRVSDARSQVFRVHDALQDEVKRRLREELQHVPHEA